MYLKTPKRYTPKGKKRRLFNLRWWWLYLLAPLAIVGGVYVWNNQDTLRPPIETFINEQLNAAGDRIATIQAPTPTATDSPVNYLTIANAAYQRGAMDEAIDNYVLAANGLPNDVPVYFRLAHLLITNGREEEGLEMADKAINADPYNPLGWAIRGMALDWLDRGEEAIASLLQALELDPNSAVTYSFLAEAYLDTGRPEAAIEAAEKALELDPQNYNVQRNYGYVMAYSGGYSDRDAAIEAFERALQIAPSRAYIAFNLADLYFIEGQVNDGVALLRDVVDRSPENASAYFKLADALLQRLGEVEQAREAVERCTAIAPENVACLSYLGALQRSDGDYNLCARTLDRAVQAGSRNALDYYYGGSCYILVDDCQRAIEILREGLTLAETFDTQSSIRDALAQCQVVVTLVPTATPIGAEIPEETPEGTE